MGFLLQEAAASNIISCNEEKNGYTTCIYFSSLSVLIYIFISTLFAKLQEKGTNKKDNIDKKCTTQITRECNKMTTLSMQKEPKYDKTIFYVKRRHL